MSRWRDVKQNKITLKEKKLPYFVISPAINRFKAFITDTFMILMPLLYIVFYIIMGSREEFAENMLAGWAYTFIPHFIIIISFWFFKSQTPGYKAYDIKLVDKNLNKPTLFRLIVRYFAFALSIILIAGLFLAIVRKDKKALHDLISGTMPIQLDS